MSFLEVLNTQHKNISYKIEKSTNTMQFLDVVVQINDKNADTLSGENQPILVYSSITNLVR